VDRGTVNIYRPDVTRDANNDAPRTIASSSSRPSRTDGSTPNYRSGDSNNSSRPAVIDRDNGALSRPDASTSRPTRNSDNNVIRPDGMPNNDRSNIPSNNQPVDNIRSNRPEPTRSSEPRQETPTRMERPEPTRNQQPVFRPEPTSRPSRVEKSEPQSQPRSVERSSPSPSSEGSGNSSRPSNRPSRND